jgi:hypothetical protein
MKIKQSTLIVLLLIATLFQTHSSYAADTLNLRDQRYCEVLLGTGGFILPNQLDVYNTIGLNECPEDLWSRLNAKKIKKENRAKSAILNGPRHWTIDGFKNSSLQNIEVKNFDGLVMRKAGILKVSLFDFLMNRKPYRIHHVSRKTTIVFLAGQKEFQLIDPQGQVYFMQSYSLEKEDQSLASLENLGSKLNLPEGWKFQVVTLKQDFFLTAPNSIAEVIQDDLKNTYQLAPGVTPSDF